MPTLPTTYNLNLFVVNIYQIGITLPYLPTALIPYFACS